MPPMQWPAVRIGYIGFGEAAQAFVAGWREAGYAAEIRAFDIVDKTRACAALGVGFMRNVEDLRDNCTHLISAVTADQQLNAATAVRQLSPGQHYWDVNSVAPGNKIRAGDLLGTGFLDLAVLSPVNPQRHQSPIIAAGSVTPSLQTELQAFFPNASVVSDAVGDATRIKMIRSVFVKGIEAVAAECALAAYQAGLDETIFPSLDNVLRHTTARGLTDYTMERVAVHGIRRAAEMEEVCATLAELGVPSHMSQAAVRMQRLIGNMHLSDVPVDSSVISRLVLNILSEENK